jgi:hypothetical protein
MVCSPQWRDIKSSGADIQEQGKIFIREPFYDLSVYCNNIYVKDKPIKVEEGG